MTLEIGLVIRVAVFGADVGFSGNRILTAEAEQRTRPEPQQQCCGAKLALDDDLRAELCDGVEFFGKFHR